MSDELRSIVVLRGNSASGKSTVAQLLRAQVRHPMALVEQDYLRRVVLKQRGNEGAPAKALIRQTVELSLDHGYDVVLDGILDTGNYGDMLRTLAARTSCVMHAYWFDVPFEETLRRHATKPVADEYGELEMRDWWHEHDLCGLAGEQVLPAALSAEECVARIRQDTGL